MLPTPDGGGSSTGEKKGMDTAKVKDINSQLTKEKTNLQAAKTEADAAAKKLQSNWKGPDADRFQNQWAKKSAKIDACINDLNAMTKQLDADITEQDTGSA
ncbi:WXG100 family type VII secretion target [Knoellia koreensis]|uniref:WXG100 family type VII secretion target n=1 Tax=Knoellia koreensis TaxID=2730921 RepID=A0A849HNU1_9MICO|nr:WXG100 family type VII secretion target [Knoellia sp. DB2414S]NNM48071.1 hypothetical protein [Knoellia sp. DB2414S]